MIKWCAYCQTYQGESSPFSSFEVSHGICENCRSLRKQYSDESIQQVSRLRQLQASLFAAGEAGDVEAAKALIETASRNGLRSIDVFMGIVTPLLHDVGQRWQDGQITFEDEHRFTKVYNEILQTMQTPQLKDKTPDLLLMSCPGNVHTLGLELIQKWLYEFSISTSVMPAGLSILDTIQMIRECSPKIFGISLALEEELPSALEVFGSLEAALKNQSPRFVLGGNAIKRNSKLQIPDTVVAIADPFQVVKICQTAKSFHIPLANA